MLEDSLQNSKSSPTDVANQLLSFLRNELPTGVNNSEQRFFNIYESIVCKIFGDIDTTTQVHKPGGWLSAKTAWPRSNRSLHSPSSSSSFSAGTSTTTTTTTSQSKATITSDPVYKLLATTTVSNTTTTSTSIPTTNNLSLLETIEWKALLYPNVSFDLTFCLLPKFLQDQFLALIDVSTVGSLSGVPSHHSSHNNNIHRHHKIFISDNCAKLINQLLSKSASQQTQLKKYKQQQQNPYYHRQAHNYNNNNHNPMMMRSTSPRSPTSTITGTAHSTATNATTTTSPNALSPTAVSVQLNADTKLLLSMLENYLVLFLRFPLAAPKDANSSSNNVSNIRGVHIHHVASSRAQRHYSPPETYGHALYASVFANTMRYFLPYQPELDRHSIDLRSFSNNNNKSHNNNNNVSELFLRLLIALWLECHFTPLPTHQVPPPPPQQSVSSAAFDWHQSYDYTVLQTMDEQSQQPVLSPTLYKCLRTLVRHVLLDPAVVRHCHDYSSATAALFALTPSMSVLQVYYYNYVRCIFRYASLHTRSDRSFESALGTWLMWLEPWNRMDPRQPPKNFSPKQATQNIMHKTLGTKLTSTTRSMKIPRYNDPSKYDPSWEPYIVANLYLYVVPLSIFLRRARELDFSPAKFQQSIQMVQRVFRVFSPDVIHVLGRHLVDAADLPESTAPLLQRHVELLGPFAPPTGAGSSLGSLQDDMQSLFEEINMQYLKKKREQDILDRMIATVEGWFGQGPASGNEKTLMLLVERAKLIAGLPTEFELLPKPGPANNNNNATSTNTKGKPDGLRDGPERDANGFLTEKGRHMVAQGLVHCDLPPVLNRADKMRRPPRQHELAILVEWTIWASDRWNVNLRFLADYRNFCFCVLCVYLIFKFLLWYFY